MRSGDMHAVSNALSLQLGRGYEAGFATATALAGIIGMAKVGEAFQNAPEGAFFSPLFSKRGDPLEVSELPPCIALAGQMITAVANNDMAMEIAIFNSAVKLGSDMFTDFMAELVTRAMKTIQEAAK